MEKISPFTRKVYRACRKIPRGKVATYSQIAQIIGQPRALRAVGNALHKNKRPATTCHRVVNCQGRLARNFGLGGQALQRKKLLLEKVKFKTKYQVDLRTALWQGKTFS